MSVGLLTQQITLLHWVPNAVEGIDGTQGAFVAGATVAASVQPARRPGTDSEETADRDTSTAELTVFIEPGPVIDAHDRFRYAGLVYEFIGPPEHWFGLAGADHLVLQGKRTEG